MQDSNNNRGEVFSKRVPAGKRTYFFDVKTTKSNDYYLVITESKRMMGDDGNPFYVKQKLFLYREDFDKFIEGLHESFDRVMEFVANGPPPDSRSHNGQEEQREEENLPKKPSKESKPSSFTDVDFDDLK
jgi:hypothetical protein